MNDLDALAPFIGILEKLSHLVGGGLLREIPMNGAARTGLDLSLGLTRAGPGSRPCRTCFLRGQWDGLLGDLRKPGALGLDHSAAFTSAIVELDRFAMITRVR
jgi:hypothetical protein